METRTIIMQITGIVAFGSILLYLTERIAMSFLGSFLFRVGIRLRTFPGTDINLDQFSIGKIYETEHAKLRRISEDSCFFCYRVGFLQPYTPFPIKGEITRNGSQTQLIWRIPLGSTLLICLWMLGWVSSPLSGMFQLTTISITIENLAISLLIFFGGLLGAVFLLFYSTWLEEKRVRLALSELIFLSLHKNERV
jgi:hypothetical protein